jgi:hypothetical protein
VQVGGGDEGQVAEQLRCGICLCTLHKLVMLVPCLHNVCAGCYSDWMRQQQTCPDCRAPCGQVGRSNTLHNVVTAFVEAHPEFLREQEEIERLDGKDRLSEAVAHLGTHANSVTSASSTSMLPPPALLAKWNAEAQESAQRVRERAHAAKEERLNCALEMAQSDADKAKINSLLLQHLLTDPIVQTDAPEAPTAAHLTTPRPSGAWNTPRALDMDVRGREHGQPRGLGLGGRTGAE